MPTLLSLLLLAPAGEPPEMETLTRPHVTVRCCAESHAVAAGLADSAEQAMLALGRLYGVPDPPAETVLWLPRRLYPHFTRQAYGFPSHTGQGIILPACDQDLPDALVALADLLNLPALQGEERRRWAGWLGLPADAPAADIDRHVRTSPEFYARYVGRFILYHELAHGVNLRSKVPAHPPWLHEWQGQWGAILACRAAGQRADAELFTAYYRRLYREGRQKVRYPSVRECERRYGQIGGDLSVPNYAWFHGALADLTARLEERFGERLGERFLLRLREDAPADHAPSNEEIVRILGVAAGQDLSGWFAEEYEIR